MNELRMHKPYPKQLLFFRSRKRYTAFGGTKPQWGFGRLSWRSHIAGKEEPVKLVTEILGGSQAETVKVRAKIRNAFYAGTAPAGAYRAQPSKARLLARRRNAERGERGLEPAHYA